MTRAREAALVLYAQMAALSGWASPMKRVWWYAAKGITVPPRTWGVWCVCEREHARWRGGRKGGRKGGRQGGRERGRERERERGREKQTEREREREREHRVR